MNITMIAGSISTLLFAVSIMPMLVKAIRTRDMVSYSFGNLALSNVANAIHSVYVYSLPIGPIWVLHTFYVVAAALMLIWYLRFGRRPVPLARKAPVPESAAAEPLASSG